MSDELKDWGDEDLEYYRDLCRLQQERIEQLEKRNGELAEKLVRAALAKAGTSTAQRIAASNIRTAIQKLAIYSDPLIRLLLGNAAILLVLYEVPCSEGGRLVEAFASLRSFDLLTEDVCSTPRILRNRNHQAALLATNLLADMFVLEKAIKEAGGARP